MSARFVINDGQHRRAAIEQALKERPELGEETLSVVIFSDAGLKRSQQMFADLNRHAVRPTTSLSILYDQRDPLAQVACRLVNRVSVFKNLTETERTSLPRRSTKLYCLSNIYQATQALFGRAKRRSVPQEQEQLGYEFWEEVARCIPEWQLAAERKVSCEELRKEYVHAHGVALQALGLAGAGLLAQEPRGWKGKLKGLRKVDWRRSNAAVWEGRAVLGGRVSKAHFHVLLTSNLLKQHLGVPLGSAEKEAEGQLTQLRKVAS
jgi:DNA sulfur modification protein DndB